MDLTVISSCAMVMVMVSYRKVATSHPSTIEYNECCVQYYLVKPRAAGISWCRRGPLMLLHTSLHGTVTNHQRRGRQPRATDCRPTPRSFTCMAMSLRSRAGGSPLTTARAASRAVIIARPRGGGWKAEAWGSGDGPVGAGPVCFIHNREILHGISSREH